MSGEVPAHRCFQSPWKWPADRKVFPGCPDGGEAAEAASRRSEKSFQTSHPLGARRRSEGGKTARGQPTAPRRARTWRRRPRRRRLSEEVGPFAAEPRCPSHRVQEPRCPPTPSAPPGVWAGPPPRSAPARPAAMGSSASSQLDEGKCAYIRGTPPGGPCGQTGRPGTGPGGGVPASTCRPLPAGAGVPRFLPARCGWRARSAGGAADARGSGAGGLGAAGAGCRLGRDLPSSAQTHLGVWSALRPDTPGLVVLRSI